MFAGTSDHGMPASLLGSWGLCASLRCLIRVPSTHAALFASQIANHMRLRHPHIIALHEVFLTKTHLVGCASCGISSAALHAVPLACAPLLPVRTAGSKDTAGL